MIELALFAAAGLLYALVGYRRERAVPGDGTRRIDRTTALVMFEAVCMAVAALVAAMLYMVTVVS
ncbi:hypothetical protein [Mycolicibacterium sp. P1-5]|uniref:hypothetical protein n=1 Tax=Mycolicibacterium sp. P1-5 TaxID=2024617 RepID=UPI0011EC589E|nr:hypothetical protein [Mycolicibacterium sp. P1-5]KAA0104666.1 hypothetical protein CIW47_21030 [Mycolicibacterium sp. P1-5]